MLLREVSRNSWGEMNFDTDLDDGDRTESDPELLAALPGAFRKSDIDEFEDCNPELPKCVVLLR